MNHIPYKLSFRNLDYFPNITVEMVGEIPVWICEYKHKDGYFGDEFSGDSLQDLFESINDAVGQEDYTLDATYNFTDK